MALKRQIGIFGQLFTSIAGIIGSGWLFASYYTAQTAGPAAIISWVIGAILMMFIALCFAEIATRFPLPGGIVRLAYFAYGYPLGCMAGWLNWLSFVITPTIEARATIQYIAHFFPLLMSKTATGFQLSWWGILLGAIILLCFVLLNWVGLKIVAWLNNIVVCWKLIVPTVTIIIFFCMHFHASNFYQHGFMPTGWSGIFQGLSVGGIVFSLIGFRTAIELAGEAKNPKVGLPVALLGSILICALIYTVLQIAFIGVISPKDIVSGWQHLNLAGSYSPLLSIASFIGVIWLVGLLIVDAIISPVDTGLVFMAATSRIIYAMSKVGYVPKFFSKTNRHNVPMMALLINFIIGLILFFPFPDWQSAMEVFVALSVMSYALGPLTLCVFRKKLPRCENAFYVPGGQCVALFAFYVSNMIIIWAGFPSVLAACVVLLIIVIFLLLRIGYFILTHRYFKYTKEFSKVLLWLSVYALCLFATSLLSSYGHYSLHLLKLGWDLIIVAIFSAVIFFWSIFICLSTERIEENVRLVAAGEL